MHQTNPSNKETSYSKQPCVWLLDDEPELIESLQWLLSTSGIASQALASPNEVFSHNFNQQPGCLLMDVRMPERSGLEVLAEMKEAAIDIPVILISGHADVPMAVKAMRLGAENFFEKPFNHQQLIDSLQQAISKHRQLLVALDQK